MHPARRWSTALAALSVVAATACAAPVAGAARPAQLIDLPTGSGEPAPGIVVPPPQGNGQILEAIRLAAATPIVREQFPDRTNPCSTTGELVAPRDVEATSFPEGTVAPVLAKYGFVTAWRACASNAEGWWTVTQSAELSDPAAARHAVVELAAASLVSGERQTTVLGGATAQVRVEEETEVVQIWVPVGRLFGYVFHQAPAGVALAEATRLAEVHSRLLASFTPTPQAGVPDVPDDPAGLSELTVRPPGDAVRGSGPFDLEATLHSSTDPIADRALLTANGFRGSFRWLTYDGAHSYAAVLQAFPGPAQAEAVRQAFVTSDAGAEGRVPFTLPGAPDASCFRTDRSVPSLASFYQRCYASRGAHLVWVDIDAIRSVDDTAAMTTLLAAQIDLIDG
ncbi:DUF7373 family lipoprotein [Pseudonocardia humida]|uniref:DUF7373 domain-containing protein n=1 Tax=Pseudonocardia humida TaxID=2800819 RepID=A0ABT1A4L3_9PSEU|nr:hypothetical protein [Pseudonocardia humida]MCO1657937.1 hypothetical protein [Pseudonocardia humida]